MASRKRERSESGFYHICQCGVNHFDIFEDDDDRDFYLDRLVECASKLGVEIHAWCLMSNHVHLLVRGELERVSAMMRRIGSRYARFFNRRHKRSGPLFGGRFLSVCVKTESQLVAVVRYIHRNPVHHGESALRGSYPWSSYGEYVGGDASICQTGFVLGFFGSLGDFIRMHEDPRDEERHLDVDTAAPMGDDEARSRANRALSDGGFGVVASQIGSLGRGPRDQAIRLVKSAVGCPIRQIQRLTAVAYSAIRCALESLPAPPRGECRWMLGISDSALLAPLPEAATSLSRG